MTDPWMTEKRPRFPKILTDILEEKKENENQGLWEVLLKENEDLQEEVREKENELAGEESVIADKNSFEPRLDDLL